MSIRLARRPHEPARPSRKRPAALVPTPVRTHAVLSQQELDLSADAIETFAAAVGGRTRLVQTLAVADSDTGSDKVINCLLDPAYANWSLRRICAYAGITIADLFASYKKALFIQAHIEAAHRITSQLPPVVDDVMRRAAPMPLVCPRCQGTPTTPDTTPCPQCQGTGTILYGPELERQKLALELGRLTQQKSGVVMQQNQIAASRTVSVTSAGSLDQLQQVVGDLLFAPGRRRAASPAPATILHTPHPTCPCPGVSRTTTPTAARRGRGGRGCPLRT